MGETRLPKPKGMSIMLILGEVKVARVKYGDTDPGAEREGQKNKCHVGAGTTHPGTEPCAKSTRESLPRLHYPELAAVAGLRRRAAHVIRLLSRCAPSVRG